MIKRMIVGLGNPGKKYNSTRHNIGFMILDSYAKHNKIKFKKSIKFNAEIAEYNETILVKPKTFMNNSGFAVEKVMNFYNIDKNNILIIQDDVDLPTMKIKLKKQGGSGGHNGIKSIISLLSDNNLKRMKIGIDKDEKMNTRNYVLSKFSNSEKKLIDNMMIEAFTIIDEFVRENKFDDIMNDHN